jgi:hypothetical protein
MYCIEKKHTFATDMPRHIHFKSQRRQAIFDGAF